MKLSAEKRHIISGSFIAGFLMLFVIVLPLKAQFDAFDPSWFDRTKPWIKIHTGDFTEDLIYEIDAAQLADHGFPMGVVMPNEVKMFDRGKEIYLEIVQQQEGPLVEGDKIRFMGQRRTGKNELWAHRYDPSKQASSFQSHFTSEMIYWLTWDPSFNGLRYRRFAAEPTQTFYEGFRDTVHLERDATEYYIDKEPESEISTYSASEGLYWNQIDVTNRDEGVFEITNRQRPEVHHFGENVNPLVLRDMIVEQNPITFEAHFASLTIGNRIASLEVKFDNNGVIDFHPVAEAEWSGKASRNLRGTLLPTDLIDTDQLEMQAQVLNLTPGQQTGHFINFDWVEFSYVRGFSFPESDPQMEFWLENDGNRSVRLTDVPESDEVYVYDPETGRKFATTASFGSQTASFFDPARSFGTRQYIAIRNNQFPNVLKIEEFESEDNIVSPSNQGEYLILTREKFKAAAQEYASYRGSKSNMTTKIVDVEEIWNIFDYGAERPIAIRRFIHYALANWEKPPKFVFILADGSLQSRFTEVPPDEIPPFGVPPSDSWFSMNYNGPEDWVPQVPVGRLTVKEPAEVRQYLNKVVPYESEPVELEDWRKKTAYLTGGNDAQEQARLQSFNRSYARQAFDSMVAADTVSFEKTSNQPLDGSRREELRELINNGTFLLHFFGHTAPNSWDLLTDDPNSYQNVGKPTVVVSLGCYSGGFESSEERIISEQFVFAPNAAVAYLGGSGAGFTSSLSRYGENFHDAIFRDTVRVLGTVHQRGVQNMRFAEGDRVPATTDLGVMLNTVIMGDPALILAYPRKPDYQFDTNPVTLNPDPATVNDTSIFVDVNLRNNGVRTDKEIELQLEHVRPQNRITNQKATVEPIETTSKVRFNVPISVEDAGRHEFRLSLDPLFELDEVTRVNNSVSTQKLVFSTTVDIISPPNNGIVNDLEPTLVVSSPTADEGETFFFELDTTRNFSEMISTSSFTSNEVKVEWEPGEQLEQGKTYHWRSRVSSTSELNWREASFVVDTTVTGTWWAQNKATFSENSFTPTVKFNEKNRRFNFSPVDMEISTSTSNWFYAATVNRRFPASTLINGVEFGRLKISFHMIVLDQFTGKILKSQHYDVHPGIFTNKGALPKEDFIRDLNNIDEGNYVIIRVRNFFLIRPEPPLFEPNSPLMDALRTVGGFKAGGGVNGDLPSQLTSGDGYILIGKKGVNNPSEVSEYIVREGMLKVDTTLQFRESRGEMISKLIGPVKEWEKLQFATDLQNISANLKVEVRGRKSPFEPSQFLNTFGGFDEQVEADLSFIDTDKYPFLELKAIMEDPANRTTPQLEEWKIKYEPLPEIAVDPNQIEVESDSVEQGFKFKFSTALNNIGLIKADTIIVEYVDFYNNQPIEITRDTLFNIEPSTSKKTSVEVETLNRVGTHELRVSISEDFRDQFSYNNFLTRDFEVIPDTVRPKIEVFANNQFIPPVNRPKFDKDDPSLPFLPARPVFDIYWRDNNPFLRITDSSRVWIELFTGTNGSRQTFRPESPELFFEPAKANGRKNEAFAQFSPDFSNVQDSVFAMTIYTQDETGNIAETSSGYTVNFRVKNEVTVKTLFPYPNPMSNRTYFSFRLTGDDISKLERFKLKIFTLSGRPVRAFDLINDAGLINLNDDGRLQIGWNKLLWDGRDQDGDRLANGVYLYTVDVKAQGERIKVNNGDVEKVVIIR